MINLSELEGLTLDDLMNLHEPEKIQVMLLDLAKKYPKSTSVHMLLSRINFLEGNTIIAAEGFRQVTAMDPKHALAFYELGICEFYRARVNDAKKAFKKVIELDDDLMMAKFWLGKCYKYQFKHEKLIKIYSTLLEKSPEWSQVACDLGLTLEEVGRSEEAISMLERVIKLNKTNAIAFYHLGSLYQKNGNLMKAIDSYRQGLKVYPNSDLLKQSLEYVTGIDMP